MNTPRTPLPLLGALLALGLSLNSACLAWGPDGHRVIGLLALQAVNADVRDELMRWGGIDDAEELADACNWPDRYRATEEGAWSAHQHYLNIPRGAGSFEPARDCPDGQCVTGAIVRYAKELSDTSLPDDVRWRAWARVCHFVGDLHQPLHAGYGDDRGGNDFPIRFNGQEGNLHQFWDRYMITANYPDWRMLASDLSWRMQSTPETPWQPAMVDEWVLESHERVMHWLYPDEPEISRAFAASSWLLALEQLPKGAMRLAWVLESSLGAVE